MKKVLLVLLACLLLCACGTNAGNTEPQETLLPAADGMYNRDHPIEQQTHGAVRVYPLDGIHCTGLNSVGSRLLLLRDDREMILLDRELCRTEGKLDLGEILSASGVGFSATDTGVAYYDQESGKVLRLNPQLQKSAEYLMPENALGTPAVSLGTQEIYYRTAQELRALNMQTGISRLLWNFGTQNIEFTGVYFAGAVLGCRVTDDSGAAQILYLSTQTGQTLSADQALSGLQTHEDAYFVQRQDGQVTQRIFGTLNTDPKSLNLDEDGILVAALPLNGIVRYIADEEALRLWFYDLTSGKQTAAASLSGVGDPVLWHADGQYLWIVAYEQDRQVLYRWDLAKSSVQDDTVYTGPLYTAQSPDTSGLAALQQRVDSMNKKYGVHIAIWQDALTQTGGYTLVGEHQVQPINQMLDRLEQVLALFPNGFLKQTVDAGAICLRLVRSIDGADHVQFWAEGDCNVVISLAADVQAAFFRGLAYGVDSHVMGNSRDFDTWKDLNPQGFTYGQIQTTLLEGENRAFVDADSMQNPYEDRSRMIACAMMEGKKDVFSSEIMQKKLLRICMGIREAYGLEKSKDTYFWEQYLNQSLAYTK